MEDEVGALRISLNLNLINHYVSLIIFAGTPPTIVLAGTSLLTTAPAATIEFSPMVTPGKIVAPAPIQALFLI